MSMIKRRLGETLSARSYRRQCRAMLLKVIAHNVLILWINELFYRAGQEQSCSALKLCVAWTTPHTT